MKRFKLGRGVLLFLLIFQSTILWSVAPHVEDPTYTININSTLQGACQTLSSLSGKNILLAPSVPSQQAVSLNVDSMPFSQILSLLLISNNLLSQTVGNSILIYPQAQESNFAQTKWVFIPLTDVSSDDVVTLIRPYLNGNLNESINSTENINGVTVNATPEHITMIKGIIESLEESSTVVTRTFHLTYCKAQEVQNALQSLMNLKNIYVNVEANTVSVEMTKSQEKKVEELIKSYDVEQPQVVIKVLILATSENMLQELGWDYSHLTTVSGGFGSLGYITFSGVPNQLIGNLNATNSKILSNPTLRIINNQKATIKIGQNIPIVIQQNTPNNNNNNNNNQPVAQLEVEYKDSGLTLNLTPIVHEDNRVTIAVDLVKSDPTSSVVQGGYSYPTFTTQSINTMITLKNTESVIFGGLIQNGENTTTTSLPILGSIPYLGDLFSYKKTNPTQTELIMLITPYIVTNIQKGKSIEYHYTSTSGSDTLYANPAKEKIDTMQQGAQF